MLIAISTSTPVSSVALLHDDTRAVAVLRRPHAHAEFLAPAIEFLIGQARCEPDRLAGVAVDIGPGLFTGLRVGIATAKGLALVAGVPMAAFTSLDLMAFGARHASRLICPIIDARRREVFWALYRSTPGGVAQLSVPRVSTPDAVVAELLAQPEEVLLLGDGVREHADAFADVERAMEAGPELSYPSAETALELAARRFAQEEFSRPRDVHPLYLRRSDAEINWGGRRQRTGRR